ncbi:uncharacterized protein [Hetaerina americana]|uniref:uncharacterized protein n=1 Tax=Hetaerina americana TaxID=62018 RepID=UPI003A7F4995
MKFYICRLCLKHQEFLIYIFRDREPERLIRKMIANTLQLRVSKDDCLPPTVCKRCVQKLKDFFLFKKDCVRAKSIFLEFSTSFKGEDDISMGNKESDDVSTEKFSSDWNDTADCEVVAHVINSKKNKYSGAKIRGKEKRQKNGVVRNVMTSLPLPSCSTAVSPKEVRRVCSEPYFDDNDCMPSSSTDDFNVSSNNNENQNCEEINIEDPQPCNEPPEEVNDNDHEVMTDLASIKMEEIDLVDDEPTMELVGERYIDYSILPVKREAVNPPSVETNCCVGLMGTTSGTNHNPSSRISSVSTFNLVLEVFSLWFTEKGHVVAETRVFDAYLWLDSLPMSRYSQKGLFECGLTAS